MTKDLVTSYLAFWGLKAPVFDRPYESFKDYFHFVENANTIKHAQFALTQNTPVLAISGQKGAGKTAAGLYLYQKLPTDNCEALFIKGPLKAAPFSFVSDKVYSYFGLENQPEGFARLCSELQEEKRRLYVFVDDADIFKDSFFRDLKGILKEAAGWLTFVLIGGESLLERVLELKGEFFKLEPISKGGARRYLLDALEKAGLSENTFSEEMVSLLYEKANGNFKNLRQLAEQTLFAGFLDEEKNLTIEHLPKSIRKNIEKTHKNPQLAVLEGKEEEPVKEGDKFSELLLFMEDKESG